MCERSPRKTCQSWLSPLGLDDPVFVDEEMADPDGTNYGAKTKSDGKRSSHLYITVLLFASVIYIGCIVSPPSLMDDSDAVIAQIARNMLTSGDWVTARMDGLAFLEKPPLMFWDVAVSYKVFGVHDWAARIPTALA